MIFFRSLQERVPQPGLLRLWNLCVHCSFASRSPGSISTEPRMGRWWLLFRYTQNFTFVQYFKLSKMTICDGQCDSFPFFVWINLTGFLQLLARMIVSRVWDTENVPMEHVSANLFGMVRRHMRKYCNLSIILSNFFVFKDNFLHKSKTFPTLNNVKKYRLIV